MDHRSSLRRHGLAGLALIAAFVGTFGAWSGFVPLSGAVVASGHFEVDGSIKKVQHKTGGVVSEILVRDGQHVSEGQVVMRLDPTMVRSELQIVVHQLANLRMTAARLRGERDGLEEFFRPARILAPDEAIFEDELYKRETRMMAARREARRGQEDGLTERINQLEKQIEGLNVQAAAKTRQREIAGSELKSLHNLLDRQLVLVAQVNTMERTATELDGDIGEIQATAAEAAAKIAETKLQILNINQVAVADASKDQRARRKTDSGPRRARTRRDQGAARRLRARAFRSHRRRRGRSWRGADDGRAGTCAPEGRGAHQPPRH
jgi:HlyD family secretion protein